MPIIAAIESNAYILLVFILFQQLKSIAIQGIRMVSLQSRTGSQEALLQYSYRSASSVLCNICICTTAFKTIEWLIKTVKHPTTNLRELCAGVYADILVQVPKRVSYSRDRATSLIFHATLNEMLSLQAVILTVFINCHSSCSCSQKINKLYNVSN